MKTGDKVRVIKIPEHFRDDERETELVFRLSLGKVFPIASIDDDRIELEVGGVVNEAAYVHSIYLDASSIEPAEE